MPSPFGKVLELGREHEPALVQFLAENGAPEIARAFHPFPLNAATAARICREPRRDRYFGIFREAELVAMGMLRGWDEGYDVPSFGLLVGRNVRARRLGKRLTLHALALARCLGAARVRITVAADDSSLLELARRLGFEPAGEARDGRLVLYADTPENAQESPVD